MTRNTYKLRCAKNILVYKMLTGFQYRAGLAITRTDLNELSNILGIHSATLIRYKKTPNLEFICARSKNVGLIISFFNSKGVLFKDKNIVLLDKKKDLIGLTRFHLVVGRIATGLNQSQLSYSYLQLRADVPWDLAKTVWSLATLAVKLLKFSSRLPRRVAVYNPAGAAAVGFAAASEAAAASLISPLRFGT